MSRNNQKGPFFQLNLIAKKTKKTIKIFNKNLTILPEYINSVFSVYNGQKFQRIKIVEQMVGHKFGEFINTRKIISRKK